MHEKEEVDRVGSRVRRGLGEQVKLSTYLQECKLKLPILDIADFITFNRTEYCWFL